MLLIVRVEEYDDVGEEEIARILPPEEWLKEHQSVFGDVLGNQRLELLSHATADSAKSFSRKTVIDYLHHEPDWNDDDNYYTTAWGQRCAKDYTTCDSDCGYCGRCEY
jgi:hypothetical protein